MAKPNGAAPTRAINKLNRSIAVPEAGKDIVLRFRFSDLAVAAAELGDDWMQEIEKRLGRNDLTLASTLWGLGCKKSDGKTAGEIDFDDIELAIDVTMGLIRDAVFLAMIGMTYQEAIKDAFERVAAARREAAEAEANGEKPEDESPDEDADPLNPAPSSSASSVGLTGAA